MSPADDQDLDTGCACLHLEAGRLRRRQRDRVSRMQAGGWGRGRLRRLSAWQKTGGSRARPHVSRPSRLTVTFQTAFAPQFIQVNISPPLPRQNRKHIHSLELFGKTSCELLPHPLTPWNVLQPSFRVLFSRSCWASADRPGV